MKSRLCFLCVLFLISCLGVKAQQAQPLPIYPGSKVALEIDVTESDFLPAMLQLLSVVPMFATPEGKSSSAISPEERVDSEQLGTGTAKPQVAETIVKVFNEELSRSLQEAFKELKRLSVVSYVLPKNARASQVCEFYMQKLGLTKGWRNVLRVENTQVLRIYAKPGLEGVFVFARSDDRVLVARTEGKINLDPLMQLVAKFGTAFAEVFKQSAPALEKSGVGEKQD